MDGKPDEEEGQQQSGEEDDYREEQDVEAAEAARKRRAREFLAGGMCGERVVLFHALCHFKRWLRAALKKRLKYLLRQHQHLCARWGRAPGGGGWLGVVLGAGGRWKRQCGTAGG